MDNYYMKYLKYKNKYNKLKNMIGANQLGGGVKNIKIDMRPYMKFLKKCIEELDYEILFSLSFDENNDIVCEFYKGFPIVNDEGVREYEKPLFNKNPNFCYINCHTHDNISGDVLKYSKNLPSPRDYMLLVENYFRYHNRYEYIYTHEGIYKLSLRQELIDNLIKYFIEMVDMHYILSRRYIRYDLTNEFKIFIDTLKSVLNELTLMMDPVRITNIDEYMEDLKIWVFDKAIPNIDEYIKHPELNLYISNILLVLVTAIETPEPNYIKLINYLGFNFELLPWDEHIIDVTIDMNVYNAVNATIKAKKEGILSDLLYPNEYIDNILNKDNENLNTNIDHNNFIILNKVDLDKLFDTIKATPHGEMVIMPK